MIYLHYLFITIVFSSQTYNLVDSFSLPITTNMWSSYKSILPPWLPTHLQSIDYQNPKPIQNAILSHLLKPNVKSSESSIILHSPTGTGKTLSYLIPLVSRIITKKRKTQGLIVVPNVELGYQVLSTLNSLLSSNSFASTYFPFSFKCSISPSISSS